MNIAITKNLNSVKSSFQSKFGNEEYIDVHFCLSQHFRALAQDNQLDNALKGGGPEDAPDDKEEERLIL